MIEQRIKKFMAQQPKELPGRITVYDVVIFLIVASAETINGV
jgi:hypothetical protein